MAVHFRSIRPEIFTCSFSQILVTHVFELQIYLDTPEDLPRASSPGPSNNLKFREFIKDDTFFDQLSNEPSPGLNRSSFFNIPNRQELLFAFDTLTLEEQKQLVTELSSKCNPEKNFEPHENLDSSMNETVKCVHVVDCKGDENLFAHIGIQVEGLHDDIHETCDVHARYGDEIIRIICNKTLLDLGYIEELQSGKTLEANLANFAHLEKLSKEMQEQLQSYKNSRDEVSRELSVVTRENENLKKANVALEDQLAVFVKDFQAEKNENLNLVAETAKLQQQLDCLRLRPMTKGESKEQSEILQNDVQLIEDESKECLEYETQLLSECNELSLFSEEKEKLSLKRAENEESDSPIDSIDSKLENVLEIAVLKQQVGLLTLQKDELSQQKDEFQEKVENFMVEKSKLEEREKHVNGLMDLNKDLQTQVERLGSQIIDESQIFASKLEAVEEISEQLKHKVKSLVSLNEELSNADTEKSLLLQTCEEQIVRLTGDLESKLSENQELVNQNSKLKSKAKELKDLLETKSSEYFELHEKYLEMEANCEQSFEVVQSLGNEVKTLNNELASMQTKLNYIETIETRNKDMQTCDFDYVDKSVQCINDCFDKEVQSSNDRIDKEIQFSNILLNRDVQSSIDVFDQEVQCSNSFMDKEVQCSKIVIDKEVQYLIDHAVEGSQSSNFMHEIAAEMYENELVHSLMQESIAEIFLELRTKQMKIENEGMQKFICSKNSEIEELKTDISYFKDEAQVLKTNLKEMSGKVAENDSELFGLKEALSLHSQENAELKLKIDSMEKEKKSVEQELQEIETQNSEMKETLSQAEAQNAELRLKLEHKAQSNDVLNSKLEEKIDLVAKLESKVSLLNRDNDTLLVENAAMKKDSEFLESKKAELQKKCNALESEKSGLIYEMGSSLNEKTQIEAKLVEIQTLAQKRESDLEKFRTECSDLHSNLKTLANEKAELKIQTDLLECEKSELKSKCEDLQSQRDVITASLRLIESKVFELTSNCEELTSVNVSLGSTKAALESEIIGLRHESEKLQKATDKMKLLELEVERVNSEKCELVAKIETEEIIRGQLQQELIEIQKLNDEMKEKTVKMVSENKTLTEEIYNFKNAVVDLQTNNLDLMTKLSDVVEYGDRLQSENAELSSQLQGFEIENNSIRRVLENVYQQLTNLTEEGKLSSDDVVESYPSPEKMEEMLKKVMSHLREKFEKSNFKISNELKEMYYEMEVKDFQINEVMEKFEKEKSEKYLLVEKLNKLMGDLNGLLEDNPENTKIEFKSSGRSDDTCDVEVSEEYNIENLSEIMMLKLDLDSSTTDDSIVAEDVNLKDIVLKLKNVLENQAELIKQLNNENESLKSKLSKYVSYEFNEVSEISNSVETNEILKEAPSRSSEINDQLRDVITHDFHEDPNNTTGNGLNQVESLQNCQHALTENADNDVIRNQKAYLNCSDVQLTSNNLSNEHTDVPISFCEEPKIEAVKSFHQHLTASSELILEEERKVTKREMNAGTEEGKELKSGVMFVESVTKGSPSKRMCAEGVCSKEVVKLMHSFDLQMANQMAIVDRKAREINELNELVKLLQTNNENIRKHGLVYKALLIPIAMPNYTNSCFFRVGRKIDSEKV